VAAGEGLIGRLQFLSPLASHARKIPHNVVW
jgi:hypothetical protein